MFETGAVAASSGKSGFINAFFRRLDDFNLILFVLLLSVATLQVFMRYVARFPLPWTEELARFLLIWVTFLGAASVTRRKIHITVEIFSQKYPPRAAAAINAVLYSIMIMFLGVVSWGSVVMFQSSWPVHAGTMPSLRMSWVYLGAVLGLTLMIGICVNHFIQEIKLLINSAHTGSNDTGKG